MNARQRRLRRRMVAPVVCLLIAGIDDAAKMMEETGQNITPDEFRALATGLREMLASNPDWQETARRVYSQVA